MTPLFPFVRVQLVGEDGNAFSIIARVQRALIRAGQRDAADAFVAQATESESYDALLRLVMNTVDINVFPDGDEDERENEYEYEPKEE
jgi:hypothetical protein